MPAIRAGIAGSAMATADRTGETTSRAGLDRKEAGVGGESDRLLEGQTRPQGRVVVVRSGRSGRLGRSHDRRRLLLPARGARPLRLLRLRLAQGPGTIRAKRIGPEARPRSDSGGSRPGRATRLFRGAAVAGDRRNTTESAGGLRVHGRSSPQRGQHHDYADSLVVLHDIGHSVSLTCFHHYDHPHTEHKKELESRQGFLYFARMDLPQKSVVGTQ